MCTSNMCCLDSMVFDLQKRIDKLEREIRLRDIDLSKRIRGDYMYWIKFLLHQNRTSYSNDSLKSEKSVEAKTMA